MPHPPGDDQPDAGRGPAAGPARARRASSRRSDIKRAAVKVFAERGYHAARVSDIAAEAGVAHGLVFHYFGTKESLLASIFQQTWSQLEEGLHSIADGPGGAGEKLAGVVRLMLGSYRLAPDLVRVVVLEVTRSGQLRQQVGEVSRTFEVIEAIVRDGQQVGELRAELDARIASYVVWGAIDEVITGWVFGTLPDGDDDVSAAERAVVELVLRGLGAPPT